MSAWYYFSRAGGGPLGDEGVDGLGDPGLGQGRGMLLCFRAVRLTIQIFRHWMKYGEGLMGGQAV